MWISAAKDALKVFDRQGDGYIMVKAGMKSIVRGLAFVVHFHHVLQVQVEDLFCWFESKLDIHFVSLKDPSMFKLNIPPLHGRLAVGGSFVTCRHTCANVAFQLTFDLCASQNWSARSSSMFSLGWAMCSQQKRPS